MPRKYVNKSKALAVAPQDGQVDIQETLHSEVRTLRTQLREAHVAHQQTLNLFKGVMGDLIRARHSSQDLPNGDRSA
jgi:hypothetical protein